MAVADPRAQLLRISLLRHGGLLAVHLAAVFAVAALSAASATTLAILSAYMILLALFWMVRARQQVLRRWTLWLDDGLAALQDSASLLRDSVRADESAAPALESLQRQRVLQQLAARSSLAQVVPWPQWHQLTLLCAVPVLLMVLMLVAQRQHATQDSPASQGVGSPHAERTFSIEAQPPAYTGLDVIRVSEADMELPADSVMRVCELGEPPTRRAWYWQASDGERHAPDENACLQVPLSHARDWVIADESGATLRAGRWRLLRDKAPQIRINLPADDVLLINSAQQSISIDIAVDDDYGIGTAALHLTLARGSGENVRFSDREQPLPASENPKQRLLKTQWTAQKFAMEAGDELYFHVTARDNRTPLAQQSRSRTVILRWPAPEQAGVEGATLPSRTLPAQFRSQRQIILDTEQLIRERASLDAETFRQRAQAIAEDQAILRLRYGEFLGEESGWLESAGHAVAPNPEMAAANSESSAEAHAEGDGHEHGDEAGHAHAPASTAGNAREAVVATMAQFGHTHDESENATLYDEATKAILRRALAAMWKAEGGLRVAEPEQALPHEYAALEAIKTLQQAERLYLHRTAFTPPPMDESMRFSGELPKTFQPRVQRRPDAAGQQDLSRWLQRLQTQALRAWSPEERQALTLFLRAQLDEVVALDALRDLNRALGDCEDCQDALLARLEPLLPEPVPAPRAERAQ